MPGSIASNTFDIIICGAGPAGTSAALTLKDSGYSVCLLDKSEFPRDKICGDALSGKVVSVARYIDEELLEGFYDFTPKIGSYGIRFLSPAGITLDIPFKKDLEALAHAPGFVSRRIDFDNFLLEKAAACNHVTWKPGVTVSDIQISEKEVSLVASGEKITGKLLIGADGAHSVVAKTTGLRNVHKKHHSAGVRAYVTGVSGFHEHNFIELHFLKDLLPGYFWIFPLPDGSANVGLGMLSSDLAKHPGLNLRKKLEEVMFTHREVAPRFKGATVEGKISGFGLPLGSRRLPISTNRVLLTGDAASLIDPFSGEGIGNAMISGRVAAQTIMDLLPENSLDGESLKEYDRRVYRKIGQELNVSRMMQRLVNYPWLFDFVAKKGNSNPSLKLLMTMMFESVDLRSELTKPSFYWKLLFGARQSAQ